MLRLTRKYKTRVSNQLAIGAAMLLMASAVAGVSGSFVSGSSPDSQMTAQSSSQANSIQKGFKASLFLFRRN